MDHFLNQDFVDKVKKSGLKDKHKNKEDFSKLSSSDKDELLYSLAMAGGLLPPEMPYKKP